MMIVWMLVALGGAFSALFLLWLFVWSLTMSQLPGRGEDVPHEF